MSRLVILIKLIVTPLNAHLNSLTMPTNIPPELKEAFEKILDEVYQPNEDDGVDIFTSISLSADLETHYQAMHAAYTLCSEAGKWISVDDEILPPFDVKTQIICDDGEQYIGYFNGADNKAHYWFCDNNDYHYPRHWRYLPNPPQSK